MLDIFPHKVIKVRQLTAHVSQIILQKATDFSHQAGQYVHVYHSENDFSPLSIASSPNEKHLEFHLYHGVHNASANRLLRRATVDKNWLLSQAYGKCTHSHLRKNQAIIFIAKGTGFAPIKAILTVLAKENFSQSIHLYWLLPTKVDLYLLDEINHLQKRFQNFRFAPIFTRELTVAKEQLLEQTIMADYGDLSAKTCYVSGPVPLVQHLQQRFVTHGLSVQDFFSDVL